MKPVIKWVGGKRQLIKDINKYMIKEYNNYYEPFIGGGSVLFELRPKTAVINDLNKELYKLYNVIKNKSTIKKLINKLDYYELNHTEELYYEVRALDRSEAFKDLLDYELAARLIYLNKTGFNGLYRVNSKGQFNVPSGKRTNVKLYDYDNLISVHNYFNEINIKVTNQDFSEVVKSSTQGDFVYFDPPYDKIKDDTFTSYHKNDFNRDDQVRLFECFKELTDKGVHVMLSNHNTEFINELYKDYYIHVVYANRMVNSNGNRRGKVEEVIITNYEVNINEEEF